MHAAGCNGSRDSLLSTDHAGTSARVVALAVKPAAVIGKNARLTPGRSLTWSYSM